MKQTTNYGLKLPEAGDALSIVPLNENARAIDAVLHTIASGQVMMACGSYTGNDSPSVTIETPGFTPRVVLMRAEGVWVDGGTNHFQAMAVPYGWCLWMGEKTITLTAEGGNYGTGDVNRTINFTAADGSLSWSTDETAGGGTGPLYIAQASRVVNNNSEYTYQWVALGVAKE